ncbi:Crp/Fnr family transcriptional regulator [Aquabacterium sp.]|uniref:Crp/Fnr family transcriptional regulator n=1 Tax=Aquabacterium sp. TaxID=1872578 RepID=UPI002E3629BE|nr:Crp/Fnr family transcriptional regulator [Aquabacterium sp.]HEX5310184.1 Crp/Fnr family transcriptional regulator [Aquabacterium sp.]
MNHQYSFAIAPYLRELPLFSDMQPAELERVAEGCIVRRASRGEMLFRVGDPCDELHAVISGQVKLFALAPNGQEKVIELISPGQTFAEALMFTGRPYIVNAQALTETSLLTVKRIAIMREIEADHRFALRMLAGISRKLHGLIHDVESYSLRSGTQRVIGYLLHGETPSLPCAYGESTQQRTVTLPVSKATLASRLSLTPEYFSRVLHELIEAGLIEVDKRQIRIQDTERLSQYQMMAA